MQRHTYLDSPYHPAHKLPAMLHGDSLLNTGNELEIAKPGGRWIIGVDPGHSGALAAIDNDNSLIALFDMPVRTFGRTGNRREVDAPTLANWIAHYFPQALYLEEVWGMVGDGGVNGFTFGDGYGTVRGICAALGVPLVKIRPGIWKASLGCNKSKDRSRERAIELFPDAATRFSRKKDDGRAEAALIAFYGINDQNLILKQSPKLCN